MDTIYTLRDAVNERNDMEEAAESRARRTIRSISLDDAAAELNLHPAIGVLLKIVVDTVPIAGIVLTH